MCSKTLMYLISIFKHSPQKIVFLWLCDLIDLIYDCFEPLLIGLTIDGLLNKNYKNFIIFIILFLFDIVINYYNSREDNRVYDEIKIYYKAKYYDEAIKSSIETSELDSNVELVDAPINFVRSFIVNYVDLLLKLLISIWFIFETFHYIIGLISIVVSIVSVSINLKYNKEQLINIDKIYNKNEKRREIIGKKNREYKKFLREIYALDISNSDIEAKSNFFVNILRMLLLAVSLIIFTKDNNVTIGLIFSGIEYIFMMTSNFDAIPDLWYEYGNVNKCIERIKLD